MIKGKSLSTLMAAGLCVFNVTSSYADTCSALVKQSGPLRNGDLFVLLPSGHWTEFTSTDELQLKRPRAVTFRYVVRELGYNEFQPSQPRRGVIVIKSGRYVTPSDDASGVPPADDKVFLRRDGRTTVTEKCPNTGAALQRRINFRQAAVRKQIYNNYHDLPGAVAPGPDLERIEAFHYQYERYDDNPKCRATNDPERDSTGRNNRSQYSFDPWVVRTGGRTQFAYVFSFIQPVQAATGSELAGQQVESTPYKTNGDKMACIEFVVPHVVNSTFIRINDLEARSFGVSEREWPEINQFRPR